MAKAKKTKKPKISATESKTNKAVQQQAQLNQQFGQINEVSPFGTSTYVTGPDGRATRTTTLSAAEQAKLDQANALDTSIQGIAQGLAGQAAKTYATPFGGTSAEQIARRRQVEDQTYNAYRSRLEPYWQNQRNQQEAMLANRGIAPGSRGYAQAMGDFGQQQNDAYLQAQNSAFTAGRGEADTLWNQGAQAYAMPAQMLQGLRGSVSGVNMPQYLQPNQTAPDYLGAFTALSAQQTQKDIARMAKSGGGGEESAAPVFGNTVVAGVNNPNQKTKGLIGLSRLSAGG